MQAQLEARIAKIAEEMRGGNYKARERKGVRGDKARYEQREKVRAALIADPSRSDRAIAKEIGCSPGVVGRLRRAIVRSKKRDGEIAELRQKFIAVEKRIGRDGKARRLKALPKEAGRPGRPVSKTTETIRHLLDEQLMRFGAAILLIKSLDGEVELSPENIKYALEQPFDPKDHMSMKDTYIKAAREYSGIIDGPNLTYRQALPELERMAKEHGFVLKVTENSFNVVKNRWRKEQGQDRRQET